MMNNRTFNWNPSCELPEQVLVNNDGTVTLPIQIKPIVDKVDAMSEQEKLDLLLRPIDTSQEITWDD